MFPMLVIIILRKLLALQPLSKLLNLLSMLSLVLSLLHPFILFYFLVCLQYVIYLRLGKHFDHCYLQERKELCQQLLVLDGVDFIRRPGPRRKVHDQYQD